MSNEGVVLSVSNASNKSEEAPVCSAAAPSKDTLESLVTFGIENKSVPPGSDRTVLGGLHFVSVKNVAFVLIASTSKSALNSIESGTISLLCAPVGTISLDARRSGCCIVGSCTSSPQHS